MLFFTRSFLCIGAVLALIEAPDLIKSNKADPGWLVGTLQSAAVEKTGEFCRHDPKRCLAVASAVAGTAWSREVAPLDPPMPRSDHSKAGSSTKSAKPPSNI